MKHHKQSEAAMLLEVIDKYRSDVAKQYKDIKKELMRQKEEAGMAFNGNVYLDVPSFYAVIDALNKASHESIRVDVLKVEKAGCDAADQCDQGTVYDRKLSNAIKTVLEWYTSPAYKMRIDSMRRFGHDV